MFGGFSSKNPTASFAPPTTPPVPRTVEEWKVALADVKQLYLQKQYKQCAARCTELLETKEPIDPIHKTFLSFYAAISYEFLGRAAHLYSGNKVSLLHSALDRFVDCGAALPAPIALPKLPKVDDSPSLSPFMTPPLTPPLTPLLTPLPFEPPTPEDRRLWLDDEKMRAADHSRLLRNLMQMTDFQLIDPSDDPFISDWETEPKTAFVLELSELATGPKFADRFKLPPPKEPTDARDPVKNDPLMPSPLRIRKVSDGQTGPGAKPDEDIDSRDKTSTRPRPPPLPLKIIPMSQSGVDSLKDNTSSNASTTKAVSSNGLGMNTPSSIYSGETKVNEELAMDITPVRAAEIVRFNRGIAFLREQITSNIISIQQHVDQITEIQRARRSRKMQRAVSFWSFSPMTTEERSEDKQEQEPEPVMDQFGNIVVKETKQQRIERLRAEGWNTVGLRSPRSAWKGARYYQEFCNMVLNELHLDK